MAEQSTLRQYAIQCMERAAIKDAAAKTAWLEMAANWLRIAGAKSRATKLGTVHNSSKSSRNKSPSPRIEFAEGRPPNPISSR